MNVQRTLSEAAVFFFISQKMQLILIKEKALHFPS